MNDLGNKEILSKNLNNYLELSGKTRTEICNVLGFKYSTFTDWINGNKYPRIDKIEMMANYFGIAKSDLIESKTVEEKHGYYINEESRKIAQMLFDNPERKLLFDASEDVSPEDLLFVAEMMRKLKKDKIK